MNLVVCGLPCSEIEHWTLFLICGLLSLNYMEVCIIEYGSQYIKNSILKLPEIFFFQKKKKPKKTEPD